MEAQIDEHQPDAINNSPAKSRHTPSKLIPFDVNNTAVTQPLLTLSGLGLAYGSLKSMMRKIKRSTNISPYKLPKYVKYLPRYMKRNYVKYPLMFIVFLAAARRIRTAINH